MDDDNHNISTQRLLNIHGYLAFTSVIIILPISILVIALGPRWDLWLIAHVGLVTAGTILFIASIIFGVLGSRSIGHLVTTHQILGVCLLALFIVGILTGIYISVRWDGLRTKTPARDKFHWWFGRALILGGFALCFHGFVAGKWAIWAYIFSTASWFIWVCVYGILRLRVTHSR